MTIAEQERRNQERYRGTVRRIATTILDGGDTVALSATLSEEIGIEQRVTYRWIQHTERELERARRRRVGFLLVPIWLGGLTALGALGARVVGVAMPAPWWAVAAGGAAVVAVGAFRLRGAAGRAAAVWIAEAEGAGDSG